MGKCGQRAFTVISLDVRIARRDSGDFMRTGWQSEASLNDTFKKRWWFGNTIEKSLLAVLHADAHLSASADFFCLLELDTAFVPENLRALVQVAKVEVGHPIFLASMHWFWKITVMPFPAAAGGLCITRAGLKQLARFLKTLPRAPLQLSEDTLDGYLSTSSWEEPTFSGWRLPGLSAQLSERLNGCGFVVGHWYDVMLGRCLVAANVSIHPGFEDDLGRYFFSHTTLPCSEHLDGMLGASQSRFPRRWWQISEVVPVERRLHQIARMLCEPFGFKHELHRYATCEPLEEASGNTGFWISPYAVGFHGYKNLSMQRHAYRVIYHGADCNWVNSYRHRVAVNTDAHN